MEVKPVKVLSDLEATQDVIVSGSLIITTTASFDTIPVVTGANGSYDVDYALHQVNDSVYQTNANIANAKLDYQYALETNKNITLTGSAQLISSLVKLNPYTTLPTGSLGLMAVSGTTLYFHNGTSWTAVT